MVGRAHRGRSAELAHLDVEERRTHERVDQGIDRPRRQVVEQDPSPDVEHRDLGFMFTTVRSLVGISATVSNSGSRSRSGG